MKYFWKTISKWPPKSQNLDDRCQKLKIIKYIMVTFLAYIYLYTYEYYSAYSVNLLKSNIIVKQNAQKHIV